MIVSGTTTIQNLYDQFSAQFPYLKIEFYNKAHEKGHGSKSEDQLSHSISISMVNPDIKPIEWKIDEELTVAEFETWIAKNLNLNVQVFRKSNELWLQTSATDSWSLAKQNGKGQRSTIDYHIEPIDITDFDVE
jgi:hypothetical protein